MTKIISDSGEQYKGHKTHGYARAMGQTGMENLDGTQAG